ncbi:MAG: IS630 family transposase [Gammaproteobacteria bacterium]|nr:IS630 family transposase [Gammaproteobacteria bacterium]
MLALSKSEKDSRKRLRLLALSHFIDGKSRTYIAEILKVSRTSVNLWVSNYLSAGLEGLESKKAKGRISYLTERQKQKLCSYIEEHSEDKHKGGRLTGESILTYIKQEFGAIYHPNAVYKLLKSMGFSWITSRSRHPKQQTGVQDAYKKFLLETILNTPGHLSLDRIDVWFQDEARFGQQNTTTRIWAPRGSRPRVVKQQQFEYAHLFGAVCPATGDTEALISPYVSKDIMRQHLLQISHKTQQGRHAVVIMDGAGWHTDDIADDFQNLTIMKLPPYSPELNPIEQVWSWIRQHHLANRCFQGYEDIVEACTTAWNHFRSDTERVMDMCSRNWASLTRT